MTTVDEYGERQWNGSQTAVIESETDPWLRDEHGQDVNLAAMIGNGTLGEVDTDCGPTILPGVFAPVNSDYSIERCDECGIFESDLEAARALAQHIGPGVTVWFHGAN